MDRFRFRNNGGDSESTGRAVAETGEEQKAQRTLGDDHGEPQYYCRKGSGAMSDDGDRAYGNCPLGSLVAFAMNLL